MEKSKWANLAINLLLFFICAALISAVFILGDALSGSKETSLLSSVVNLTFCSCLFIVVYQLKRIVKNVLENKAFIDENVKRLNFIAYPFYVNAIIICFVNNKDAGTVIMGFGDFFAIKMESAMFLTLGCIASLMAYIFGEAIRIKKEAEDLKEESKYTI